MKLLVATTNQHKLAEIRRYFDGKDVELCSLLDFPGYPDVIEDGATFQENAIKKANAYYAFTGVLTLADDSGLEIDALDGQPGVLSARFAGDGATSLALCSKVLGLMACVPWEKRTARFRCVMALAYGSGIEIAEGTAEGYIAQTMSGSDGFGYDPVFYRDEEQLTFAQIDMETKNFISHRGKALNDLKLLLDKYKTIR